MNRVATGCIRRGRINRKNGRWTEAGGRHSRRRKFPAAIATRPNAPPERGPLGGAVVVWAR